jgi:hypothetical protein
MHMIAGDLLPSPWMKEGKSEGEKWTTPHPSFSREGRRTYSDCRLNPELCTRPSNSPRTLGKCPRGNELSKIRNR